MTIGENIRRLRERSRMNQSELAHAIGVTRSLISQYEADLVAPRMGNVEKLALALNCKKSDIIEERPPRSGYELTDNERELIDTYRQLNARDRAAVLQLAHTLSSNAVTTSGARIA